MALACDWKLSRGSKIRQSASGLVQSDCCREGVNVASRINASL